jgi:hypothetical protein
MKNSCSWAKNNVVQKQSLTFIISLYYLGASIGPKD